MNSQKTNESSHWTGDVFGGLAATLVAFPAAIAFGLVVYSPLGPEFAARGALAGILGAIAIGLIAPLFGGAPRLISAPCAPAAAVLAALVTEAINNSDRIHVGAIPSIIVLVALGAGVLQLLFGYLGGGKLIKFIPYPVVSGYLSGVGLLIMCGQISKFAGFPKGTSPWSGILTPSLWSAPAILVGLTSIAAMLIAPRLTKKIPASIISLLTGVTTYFTCSLFWPELQTLATNPLLIGSISAPKDLSFAKVFIEHWSFLTGAGWTGISFLLAPILTLAVLLSIDTLKTCVVLDALTKTRHDSNRELIGQGLGNFGSAMIGGMPGAGTMGATLVNLTSGGQTRRSGVVVGIFSLAVFLVLSRLVAWVPIASLAGILIVVGFRMIDRQSFKLLRQRQTILDFSVIAAVVLTAVLFNLMAASGVGLALSILLYLRDQIRGSVIRRKMLGNSSFSKKRRHPEEMAILEAKGGQTAIFQLQGSLFFGTTDQLFTEIDPYLSKNKYIILDLHRVQSLDFTAVHILELIEARLSEHGGTLIFTNVPHRLPGGRDLLAYMSQVGLLQSKRHIEIFDDLDDALEWVEDKTLKAEGLIAKDETPCELSEISILENLENDDLAILKSLVQPISLKKGEKVFSQGDAGDELFMVRRGEIKAVIPLADGKSIHLATFGRGGFFGDLAFLDKKPRSAAAVAATACDIFVLSRKRFDEAAKQHPSLAGSVFNHLACILSHRLRTTDAELRALEES